MLEGCAGGVKQRIMVNSADSTYHYIRDRHIGSVGIWLNEQARSFHTGYKGSKVGHIPPSLDQHTLLAHSFKIILPVKHLSEGLLICLLYHIIHHLSQIPFRLPRLVSRWPSSTHGIPWCSVLPLQAPTSLAPHVTCERRARPEPGWHVQAAELKELKEFTSKLKSLPQIQRHIELLTAVQTASGRASFKERISLEQEVLDEPVTEAACQILEVRMSVGGAATESWFLAHGECMVEFCISRRAALEIGGAILQSSGGAIQAGWLSMWRSHKKGLLSRLS